MDCVKVLFSITLQWTITGYLIASLCRLAIFLFYKVSVTNTNRQREEIIRHGIRTTDYSVEEHGKGIQDGERTGRGAG